MSRDREEMLAREIVEKASAIYEDHPLDGSAWTAMTESYVSQIVAALRASAAPSDGMNHRTTAEPDQRSGHRSAEDAATITDEHLAISGLNKDWNKAMKLAGELADALCPFAEVYSGGDGYEDYTADKPATVICGRVKHYGLTLGNFETAAKTLHAALKVFDHQSDNSEPQEAVVQILPDAGDTRKRPFAFAVRRAPENGDAWRLFMDEGEAREAAEQLDGDYIGLYRVEDRDAGDTRGEVERLKEEIRKVHRVYWSGPDVDHTEVGAALLGLFATALSQTAKPEKGDVTEHLRQIKAFAGTIGGHNFLDIALHISRQADEALAISSAEGKTP